MTTKICKRCNTEKDIQDFSVFARAKDGLCSWCKQCKRDHSKQKYLDDPKAHRARCDVWKAKNNKKI